MQCRIFCSLYAVLFNGIQQVLSSRRLWARLLFEAIIKLSVFPSLFSKNKFDPLIDFGWMEKHYYQHSSMSVIAVASSQGLSLWFLDQLIHLSNKIWRQLCWCMFEGILKAVMRSELINFYWRKSECLSRWLLLRWLLKFTQLKHYILVIGIFTTLRMALKYKFNWNGLHILANGKMREIMSTPHIATLWELCDIILYTLCSHPAPSVSNNRMVIFLPHICRWSVYG